MKLRIILSVLSLLALLSTLTGGYLYYSSLKESAFKEADRQAVLHAETIKNHLSSFLDENLKSVRSLAGLKELRGALSKTDDDSLVKANAILDHFKSALDINVCYLMDHDGNTIASSNRNASDSFVGKNYSFRPYYQQAIQGHPAIYTALGITSKKRGVYYSHPVNKKGEDRPIGVAVIKAPIEPIEEEFSQAYEGIVLLTDPHGVIFISNRKEWLYHTLWKLSPKEISQIARSQQFGKGPWSWVGLDMKDRKHAVDESGNEYLIYKIEIDNYQGWNIIFMQSLKAISKSVTDPLKGIAGSVTLILCVLIGLSVFLLYRKASNEIVQRKAAEEALQESEETAQALLNAPTDRALLLDTRGIILALNKPAADAFGKGLDELIGLCVFDLFSPDIALHRKAYHDEVVRSSKPVHYEDDRESRYLDTNIYPIFDAQGKVVRVALFSRDITEQKKTEKELRVAKENLSRYSKDLERQVTERTREIQSILKNTPAMVYIKDKKCLYIIVNPKFEKLFGISNEEIQGKSDYDIFPKEIADQLRANDLKVLKERGSIQVEERIPQEEGIHTYLSVKFPLYDEKGSIRGVCGISTDISTIKKAQDQLRRLSGSIMASQEKERTAISRELHDELGQVLTALRLDSVWLQGRLKDTDVKASERALTMCDLIDKTIDEVQTMAVRLRPGVLDNLGLIDALEWYCNDFEKRIGIACNFQHLIVPTVNDIVATAAYRITQEALTNVARHSFATQVDIALQAQDGILRLVVSDNGVGFNTLKIAESEALGVAGMRERASLVGGTLEIQSQLGKGTRVYFRLAMDG
jgi:PAS domain S-box-containing protein